MAFDFFGAWSTRSGHDSQLYAMSDETEPSASSGAAYIMSRGFPAGGLLLGIPTYGRSFLHAKGAGQKFKGGGGDGGIFEYSELPRKGCKETMDKRHISAQCVGGDGGFVTYDNPDTVKAKAAFVKQQGLGVSIYCINETSPVVRKKTRREGTWPLTVFGQGLVYWDGPADSKEKPRSLVAAGFRALHSS